MGYIGHMAPKLPWEVRNLSNLLPQTLISKLCFKNFQARAMLDISYVKKANTISLNGLNIKVLR